jgi:hypothetical protein
MLNDIGGTAEWLTRQTRNLMIASHNGSNPVRGKSFSFDLITQYWFVPETDLKVCL